MIFRQKKNSLKLLDILDSKFSRDDLLFEFAPLLMRFWQTHTSCNGDERRGTDQSPNAVVIVACVSRRVAMDAMMMSKSGATASPSASLRGVGGNASRSDTASSSVLLTSAGFPTSPVVVVASFASASKNREMPMSVGSSKQLDVAAAAAAGRVPRQGRLQQSTNTPKMTLRSANQWLTSTHSTPPVPPPAEVCRILAEADIEALSKEQNLLGMQPFLPLRRVALPVGMGSDNMTTAVRNHDPSATRHGGTPTGIGAPSREWAIAAALAESGAGSSWAPAASHPPPPAAASPHVASPGRRTNVLRVGGAAAAVARRSPATTLFGAGPSSRQDVVAMPKGELHSASGVSAGPALTFPTLAIGGIGARRRAQQDARNRLVYYTHEHALTALLHEQQHASATSGKCFGPYNAACADAEAIIRLSFTGTPQSSISSPGTPAAAILPAVSRVNMPIPPYHSTAGFVAACECALMSAYDHVSQAAMVDRHASALLGTAAGGSAVAMTDWRRVDDMRLRVAMASLVLDALVAAKAVPAILSTIHAELMNAIYVSQGTETMPVVTGMANGPRTRSDSGLRSQALTCEGYFDMPLQLEHRTAAEAQVRELVRSEQHRHVQDRAVAVAVREVLGWQRSLKQVVFTAWRDLTKRSGAASAIGRSLAVLLRSNDHSRRSRSYIAWKMFASRKRTAHSAVAISIDTSHPAKQSPTAADLSLATQSVIDDTLTRLNEIMDGMETAVHRMARATSQAEATHTHTSSHSQQQQQHSIDLLPPQPIAVSDLRSISQSFAQGDALRRHLLRWRVLAAENPGQLLAGAATGDFEAMLASSASMTVSDALKPMPAATSSPASSALRHLAAGQSLANISSPVSSPKNRRGGRGVPSGGGQQDKEIYSGSIDEVCPKLCRRPTEDVVLQWVNTLIHCNGSFNSLNLHASSLEVSFLDGKALVALLCSVFPHCGADYIISVEPATRRCDKVIAAIVDVNPELRGVISGLDVANGSLAIVAVLAWLFQQWCVNHFFDFQEIDSSLGTTGGAASGNYTSLTATAGGSSEDEPALRPVYAFLEAVGLPARGLRRTIRDLCDRIFMWSQSRLAAHLKEQESSMAMSTGVSSSDLVYLTTVNPYYLGSAAMTPGPAGVVDVSTGVASSASRLRLDPTRECAKLSSVLKIHYAQLKRIFDFYRTLNNVPSPPPEAAGQKATAKSVEVNHEASMTLDYTEFVRLLIDTQVLSSTAGGGGGASSYSTGGGQAPAVSHQGSKKYGAAASSGGKATSHSNAGNSMVRYQLNKATVLALAADVAKRILRETKTDEEINAIAYDPALTTSPSTEASGGGAATSTSLPGSAAIRTVGNNNTTLTRRASMSEQGIKGNSPVVPVAAGGIELMHKRLVHHLQITKSVFIELLIRLVVQFALEGDGSGAAGGGSDGVRAGGGSPSASSTPALLGPILDDFLRTQLFPRAMSSARGDFKRLCADSKMTDVLSSPVTVRMLSKIYHHFAASDSKGKPVMHLQTFVNMVYELQVLDRSFKKTDIVNLFLEVQDDSENTDDEDGENMTQSEFTEAIVALALVKFPNPLQSAHIRGGRFLDTVFFPVARSHLSMRSDPVKRGA